MSVIVMGMEMPKSCSKCGFFDMGGGDGYRCTLLRKSFEMWNKISVARDRFCPLIEIPTPHGRLIDADALLTNTIYNPMSPPYITKEMVLDAKTVIEAERSET